ncbi:MAG: hypothetical protein U0236_16205 [Nitrospira sp.]
MNASRRFGETGRRWSVLGFSALAAVFGLGAGTSVALDRPPMQEQRIEIAIRDSVYVRTKTMAIRPGIPTTIVIRNEDAVTHGFISPTFSGRRVLLTYDGLEVFGTGIEGVHVDPGKTVGIRLTLDQEGPITFRCDLHPNVQGELYILDVPVG